MRLIGKTLVGFILMSALGCATIEYHYDPGAAPQWIRGGDSQADGELRAVGLTPVTQDVARDRQRALNDAKSKLGQVVNSRVESVHRDFLASGNIGAKGKVASVQVQTVKVESMVDLGEVRTLATFRDEITRTHYVQVGVDRLKWRARVEANLEKNLGTLSQLRLRAKELKTAGQIFALLKLRRESDAVLSQVNADMMVAKTLGTSVDWSSRLAESTGELAQLSKYLADEVTVEVQCLEPAGPRACPAFRQGFVSFLNTLEVGVAGGGSAKLVVDVSFSCRSEGTKAVGKSVEFLASSAYKFRVRGNAGESIKALEAERSLGERTVRSTTEQRALTQAIEVAGEDALSTLRSRIRKELK